jgi:pimeloyl-ACP methyl ester carboxylesterase
MPSPEPRPFVVHVDDAVLADLSDRLSRTRWPDAPPHGAPWEFGTDLAYLQELVAYWRQWIRFDWRAQEAALNRFRHFVARIDDLDLHFIHEPGVGPEPLPLLLSHGWPGSVWEFRALIPMLTDPARFGGDPADAFTVVAPSLPGYAFSFRPGQRRLSLQEMAAVFASLMTDVLGYRRFAAQGGDLGAFISAALGLALPHPERLVGIHLNMIPVRRDGPPPEGDSPDIAAYREQLAHWLREEYAYASLQGTKPQTLAYGLTDSPVGLAAWIVEKFRRWSDCDGDVERCFSKDDLLTNIMLYWATGAIGSSFWPYYARAHGHPWPLPGDRRVEVPTAYAAFPKEILRPPRALAERAFNIRRWTAFDRGGHFAALEQPAALADDIRAFYRDLR